MDNLTELYNEIDKAESEEVYIPKRRPQEKELITRYDYAEYFGRIINKPTMYVLSRTKGQPLTWFIDTYSYLKTYRDNHDGKVKHIMWFLKETKLVDIPIAKP